MRWVIFTISLWHFFGDTGSISAPFIKISTSFLKVVELLLKNVSSHFVLVPTKRRFDITEFFNSYSSERKSELPLGNPVNTLFSFLLTVNPSDIKDGTSTEKFSDDAISFSNPRVLSRGCLHFSSRCRSGCQES